MNKALIFGAGGQIGSMMSRYLLDKGFHVDAVLRRAATPNTSNIQDLLENKKFNIITGDITDVANTRYIVEQSRPDICLNFAAQSHVGHSFQLSNSTFRSVAEGALNVFDACLQTSKNIRVYQASSSEMFGSFIDKDGFQRETTEMMPQSPYAVAKLAAHRMARVYRASYDQFITCGIMFNSESNFRGHDFVTRKITLYVAKLYHHMKNSVTEMEPLKLGCTDSRRDWGWAGDVCEGAYLALNHNEADDYVFATGETWSIEDFLNRAFSFIRLDWKDHVVVDQKLARPNEVNYLKGDATKARTILGWNNSMTFAELVDHMISSDIHLLYKEKIYQN